MKQTLAFPAGRARSSDGRVRRRLLTASLAGVLAAAALLIAPALASADTSSTLTVVGTSDVSDSGLVPNVIMPQFKTAFPQFSFHYVGSATGAAIQAAENGTGGPSALIVHAASLENQFVAQGFSLNNQFGNAIFTNDFVLTGNNADPAGVLAGAPNNIAQAFADVATAGQAATATYYSRGGTTNASGTTVEEHALWALVDSSGLGSALAPNFLCAVSAADGGGETPIAAGNGITANGQPCPAGAPDNGSVDQTHAPAWYHINAGNQAANVVATNACTAPPGNGTDCYSLTDRGTFDYLLSGNDPAGTIPNLKIVTRNNSPSAPGGANELTNYFHVYIINPDKPGETVNVPAAQDFVSFLTSQGFQSQLKSYLNTTTDPAGAPFVADASPTITASGLPSVTTAGRSVTVSGDVVQPQPGFPALANQPVVVDQLVGGVPLQVASGTTDASGHYSVSFVPGSSGSFQVATPQLSQIENASLSPAYGDLLAPGATSASSTSVQGLVSLLTAKVSSQSVTVSGGILPTAPDSSGQVTLLARKGTTGSFSQFGGSALSAGQSAYAATGNLTPGTWQVEAVYSDPGRLLSATSRTVNVTIPNAPSGSPTASFKKLKVKNGALTVSGQLGRAVSGSGAQVKLFALRTVTIKKAGKKVKKSILVRVDATGFKQAGKANVKNGSKNFTVKAKLKRGARYVLQLQFSQKGAPTTFSKLRTVDVH
jgi:tungstate transport system substrate-binding protein